MRIKSVQLKNFKRFTDLTISGIPDTAKLVVVVGPNGCGKSSLFDAFSHWYRMSTTGNWNGDLAFYKKEGDAPFDLMQTVTVHLHGGVQIGEGGLYVRTAYRHDADFQATRINAPEDPRAIHSPMLQLRSIDTDKTVSDNFNRLVVESSSVLHDPKNRPLPAGELSDAMIGGVRKSLKAVFDNLTLHNLGPDFLTSRATFFFEKGSAKDYPYKNLSGGEKAAFDILLDLHCKKRFFPDAIYCIDEVEAHLHTSVQSRLVREIISVVPEESQLWITTHSLGVLRAVQELEISQPGSVCVIDFEGVSVDTETTLTPTSLSPTVWSKLQSIALDDLSERIAPKVVVICEGNSLGKGRKSFDAGIYNQIFGGHYPIVFVPGGSSSEVPQSAALIRDVIKAAYQGPRIATVVDGDGATQGYRDEHDSSDHIILTERNLEAYLLADDVLQALLAKQGRPELASEVHEIKSNALLSNLNRPRPKPSNDLKAASGTLFIGLQSLLGETLARDADDFMRHVLAPLIIPGLPTYHRLEQEIVHKLFR